MVTTVASIFSCDWESDLCADIIYSFKIDVGDDEVAIIKREKICSSSQVRTDDWLPYRCSSFYFTAQAQGSVFQDLKCKYETCSTDGCNNQMVTAISTATGLSVSFFLFASIAITMFD
jgi:hypothetical protein